MNTKWKLSILVTICGLLLVLVAQARLSTAQTTDATAVQKVIAPAGVLDASQEGVTLWHDYGAFALYKVTDKALLNVPTAVRSQLTMASDMDRILLDAQPFNTQEETLSIPANKQYAALEGSALHLVQFVGPIKDSWLREIEAVGATPVHYIANNAYLVWVDEAGRTALDKMAAQNDILQYSAVYEPFFKYGPTLRDQNLRTSDNLLTVTVQMYRHDGRSATEALVKELAVDQLSSWDPVLAYQNIIVTLPSKAIDTLAQQPDVYWIGERLEREKMDEVQGQILAGNFNGDQSGPSGTGYLPWLSGYGFSTDPADYPIVDVTDDGVGDGTVNSGDYTLHEMGDVGNPTRLNYVDNCTSEPNGEGPDGHGHINTNIVGGYDPNEGAGFPFEDPNGYLRGMGINPFTRLASTRIFDDAGYDISNCGGTDTGVIKSSQDNGAHISTNSWGCAGCAGSYDDGSQAYDVGVRDADLTEPGNQELMFVFAAGNSGSGSGTVGSPGNGKNMLTVGASENQRPTDEDGNWMDGCGVGPTGADNAMDVIGFSSRGPAPGGRVKPEVIAPGTHIQGTASTNGSYNGSGVCDQYRPSGQTTFAASSGTSHSTPAVAGVSSLAYYWLQNNQAVDGAGGSYEPSPAVLKAYVMNHPTYLTGVSANDTLPSNVQGYGMPNMGMMFDNTPKYVLDQSVVFDNTGEQWVWSGAVADPSKPVRIMLVYTDKAGAIGTSPQVNDLNLEATFGADTYLGNHFSGEWSTMGGSADALNNYEAIFLPAGTSGAFNITVTGFNIADDGIPNFGDTTDQDFALVCYNCAQQQGFGLSVTPDSQDVCTPDDALYDVDVASILGYTGSVSLSASGNPAGTTANFGTASGSAPYSTTLTIGNTGAGSFGDYDIDVVATGPTATFTSTVGLSLFTAVPNAPTLTTPADGAVDQDLQPLFEWQAVDQSQGYMLEVATDAGFSNVVYTATVAGTSHVMSGDSLDPDTTFYWRVKADNICGDGAYSTANSFTTVLLYCSFPGAPITDNNTITDTLMISNPDNIGDINVVVNANHTFIGDLDITLAHEESGTTVELLPASFLCSGDDVDATFDDEAGNPISCGTGTPALSGDVQPSGSLASVDYLSLAGSWHLIVTDSAGGDQGTLNEWCIQPTFVDEIGTLEGTVTDINSGDPLVGLPVAITDGVNEYTAVTDAAGMYMRDLGIGTYTVTASAPNYETITVDNVAISDGVVTTQDFALQAGQLLSSADNFAATVVFSDSATATWTLTNTGTLPVEFQIRAQETGYSPETSAPTAEDFLIVNDSGFNATPAGAIATALDNLGYTYTTIDSGSSGDFDTTPVADLLAYKAVLYVGTISGTSAEATKVHEFLDAGGRLLVADNDLGYFGSTTTEEYLQYTQNSDSGSDGVVNGVDIMAGISTDISSDPYPDDVTLRPDGVGIFEAPSGEWAGVRTERNGYKAIALFWEYHRADGDTVGDPVETDIMEAALNWLVGSTELWLSTDIVTGTLDVGLSSTIVVTMDSSLVDLPGTYYGDLTVQNDTPYGDLVVPVTMTTDCPDCGNISGSITDVETSAPLSATVQITTTGGYDQSLMGTSYSINLVPDTYYLTARAPGYFDSTTAVVNVTTGSSDVIDFALLRQYATLEYNPAEIEEDMEVGDVVTNTVTVTNSGTIPLDFSVGIGNIVLPSLISKPSPVGPATTNAPAVETSKELQRESAAEVAVDGDSTAVASPLTGFDIAAGNVIYDNGPLVNCSGCGVGGADEAVLQSVSLGLDTLGFGHQVAAGNRIADDFTVTGAGWTLDTVTFFAYQTGSSTTSSITAVNVRIWDGPPNDPASNVIFGDETTNRMISTGWSNVYRVTETTTGANTERPIMASVVDLEGLFLPPGTYWFDWQTDGSLPSGPWAPPININGEDTTGNALQSLVGSWGPALDGGIGTPQGFPFIIEGSASGDWAFATPNSGTVPPNSTMTFDVVFDATDVAREGTYTADLAFSGNFENSVMDMPLTMNITCPTCGSVSGTLTDSFTGNPVVGSVRITSTTGFNTLLPADGSYTADLLPGTYGLTAEAPGYISSDTTLVTIATGGSETADFVLTYASARVDTDPMMLDVTVTFGEVVTEMMTISNTGAFTTPYTIDSMAAWLTTDPMSGTLTVGQSEMVGVVFDTSTFTQTGVYTSMLAINSDDSQSPRMVPVMMTVVSPPSSMDLDVTVSTSNECGTAETLQVEAGTVVYYCYTVHNTGEAMLPHHVITDSVYGHIDTFLFDLMPEATESVVYSQTVNADTDSMVMWEATNDLLEVTTVATDTVSVVVNEYGVDLSAAMDMSGEPGMTVTYTVDITNTGNTTDTFTLTLSGNGWTTDGPADVTLGAGEMGSLVFTVEIPADATEGMSDAATVMATSQSEASATDSTTLTTTAVVEDWTLYLPLISK